MPILSIQMSHKQTKKSYAGERLLYHGVPPIALATNRCAEKEPQKPEENVKKLYGLDFKSGIIAKYVSHGK